MTQKIKEEDRKMRERFCEGIRIESEYYKIEGEDSGGLVGRFGEWGVRAYIHKEMSGSAR